MNDNTFASLGLAEPLLSALVNEGYEEPTPIQTASIPSILEGRDLLGCAQTGTGKTAAFALPIIQRLIASSTRPAPRACRCLVVAPTRELAAQIDTSFGAYGKGARLTKTCVFGGVGKSPQVKALTRGVDVLVATPGRLLDLQSEGQIRLDSVEIVVLDEADRMFDMGFIRDVRRIMSLVPAKRQTLLFSATMPPDIAKLASTVLKDPVRVSVTPEKPTVDLIDQKVAFVAKSDKRAYLAALIHAQAAERAIVFTRTKHGADRLVKGLEASGIASAAIHANKSQNNRTKTMDGFRAGNLRVLVATDLAARGIDVDGITHVYNYELPEVAETYVHRIGRTARAGASGSAVALCDNDEKPLLKAIEKLLRTSVPLANGPEFETARKGAAIAKREEELNPPTLLERESQRRADSRGSYPRERFGRPVRSGSSSPAGSRSGTGTGARSSGSGAETRSGGSADRQRSSSRSSSSPSNRGTGQSRSFSADRSVGRQRAR